MKVFSVIAIIALAGLSAPVRANVGEVEVSLFRFWMDQYDMEFTGDEYDMRLAIFAANHHKIEKHNAGNSTWTMGHNQFSHMTADEWNAAVKGFERPETDNGDRVDLSEYITIADSVDWVSKGAVTPVKNQGQCGSCWSFSTTGGLEGAYFLKNGELKSFSEGMLVDCDTVDDGCNGGLMDNAFGWIKKNGGLCTEEAYPYEPKDATCASSECTVVEGSAPTAWTDVAKSESALQAAVSLAPVSIAIEADQESFQLYSGGVMTETCGSKLDHGVLAVGYGTLNGVEYWKVKNSWGASWGDEGYILLEKGKEQTGGQCGILMAASYPQL
jgi:C1A family cysteine protease